jgi:hypothetical protein
MRFNSLFRLSGHLSDRPIFIITDQRFCIITIQYGWRHVSIKILYRQHPGWKDEKDGNACSENGNACSEK